MTNKALSAWIIGFLSLCLLAPSAQGAQSAPAKPLTASSVAESGNSFGVTMLKEIWKHKPGQNVVISPVSISMALSMLLNGCNGTTASEIAQVLNLDASDLNKLNSACADLHDELLAADPDVQLEIANALFAANSAKLDKDFIKRLTRSYQARARTLDFAHDPDGSLKVINDWADSSTHGKIPKILGAVDKNSQLIIANAVYMKAEWQSKFAPHLTRNRDFFLSNGQKKKVATMKQEDPDYYDDGSVQFVRLPYGTGGLSMFIVLPAANVPVANVLNNLNGKAFQQYRRQAKPALVELRLPRMHVEYERSLVGDLRTLGMKSVFKGGADLSRMFSQSNPRFSVGEIVHKTFLAVDEEGTEAAAVTAIEVGASPVVAGPTPKLMDVNRPFIFFIADSAMGAILFTGVIVDPAAQ